MNRRNFLSSAFALTAGLAIPFELQARSMPVVQWSAGRRLLELMKLFDPDTKDWSKYYSIYVINDGKELRGTFLKKIERIESPEVKLVLDYGKFDCLTTAKVHSLRVFNPNGVFLKECPFHTSFTFVRGDILNVEYRLTMGAF